MVAVLFEAVDDWEVDLTKNEVLIWKGENEKGFIGSCVYHQDIHTYRVSVVNPISGQELSEDVVLDEPLVNCQIDPDNDDFQSTIEICVRLGQKLKRLN